MIHIYRYTFNQRSPLYIAINHRLNIWAPACSDVSRLDMTYFNVPTVNPNWQLLGTTNSLPVSPDTHPELFI